MGTWIKVDDGLPEHPKIVTAGHQAGWLYVCGLAYCSRNLTNGRIPRQVVPRLADVPRPMQVAARLVEAGLWTDEGPWFVVHDYLQWQRGAEQVDREREAARLRKRRQRSPNGATPNPTNTGDVTVMSRRDIAGSHGHVTAMSQPGHTTRGRGRDRGEITPRFSRYPRARPQTVHRPPSTPVAA